jgi:hypothetical protein
MHWYPIRSERGRGWGGLFWLTAAGLLVVGSVAVIAHGAHTKATNRPPLPSCGSVNVLNDGLRQVGTGDSELCLVRALRTCTSGSLNYVEHGVDTGELHALRVERVAGGCHIVDDVTSYGVRDSAGAEVTCSGTRWDGSGWLLTGCVDHSSRPVEDVRLWWPLQPGQLGVRPGQVSPFPEPSL